MEGGEGEIIAGGEGEVIAGGEGEVIAGGEGDVMSTRIEDRIGAMAWRNVGRSDSSSVCLRLAESLASSFRFFSIRVVI